MLAKQVMTTKVVVVAAEASVYDAAEILLNFAISAAPVVDADGRMIGIVSEADLMHRPEIATLPTRSWLERLLADDARLAHEFVRSHSHRVADVMTKDVISAEEHSTLKEIAALMKRHHVKRIPILRDGRIVGIVGRANLLQGLLAREPLATSSPVADDTVRAAVTAELAKHDWATAWPINVVAQSGVVHLWGLASNATMKTACQVAAEGVPGVKRVRNHLTLVPPEVHFGI
jgi:CBS domain-containing protein